MIVIYMFILLNRSLDWDKHVEYHYMFHCTCIIICILGNESVVLFKILYSEMIYHLQQYNEKG